MSPPARSAKATRSRSARKRVVAPGHMDAEAPGGEELLLQSEGVLQNDVFLAQAALGRGTRIHPAVAGVYHDRPVPFAGGRRRSGGGGGARAPRAGRSGAAIVRGAGKAAASAGGKIHHQALPAACRTRQGEDCGREGGGREIQDDAAAGLGEAPVAEAGDEAEPLGGEARVPIHELGVNDDAPRIAEGGDPAMPAAHRRQGRSGCSRRAARGAARHRARRRQGQARGTRGGQGPREPRGPPPRGSPVPPVPPVPAALWSDPGTSLRLSLGPHGAFFVAPLGLGPPRGLPPLGGSWRPPQGLLCPPEGRGPHVRPQAGGLQGNGEKKRWIPAACAQEAIGLYSLPCSALGGGAFTLLHPLGAPPSATSGDGGTFKRRGTSEEAPFRFPAGHGSQSQSRGLRPAGSVSEPPRLAAPARSTPRPPSCSIRLGGCGLRHPFAAFACAIRLEADASCGIRPATPAPRPRARFLRPLRAEPA